MGKWLGFAAAALIPMMLAGVFLTHDPVQYPTTTRPATHDAGQEAVSPPPTLLLPRDLTEEDDPGAIDFFGNTVTDAVAEYKMDSTGEPYEVHSPRTELPKLGSPQS